MPRPQSHETSGHPASDIATVGVRASLMQCVLLALASYDTADALPVSQHDLSGMLAEVDRVGKATLQADTHALHALHRALFLLYEDLVRPPTPAGEDAQFDTNVLAVRSRLELWADRFEAQRVPDLRGCTLDADGTIAEIQQIWRTYKTPNHPIFEYVRAHASREAVLEYLRSDYILNIRFYDLITFSLIAADERVRGEVAHNLWDEVGQGNLRRTHVQLYRDLVRSEGIDPSIERMDAHLSWQGLAGYNLMMRHGLHRSRYFESLGSLAITEIADPEQYKKFVEGCRRVGVGGRNEVGLAYYEEHISVDVLHGDGWLDNVIRPMLQTWPQGAVKVLSGVYQRLNTAHDYWDDLLRRMREIDAKRTASAPQQVSLRTIDQNQLEALVS